MRSHLLFFVLHSAVALGANAMEYPIEFKCRGLEQYDIRGTHDVDWAWGTIRAQSGGFAIGFAVGWMVRDAVPAERPAGFRTFKIERIGKVVLRYGLNVRENVMYATLTGAPMNWRVNLAAHPRHTDELIRLARVLSTAPCTSRIDRR